MVNEKGEFFTFPAWEWAEWADGHVVFAEAGCLYRRALTSQRKVGEPRLIYDFNGYTFEARAAPY